jgi:hypothetical protein
MKVVARLSLLVKEQELTVLLVMGCAWIEMTKTLLVAEWTQVTGMGHNHQRHRYHQHCYQCIHLLRHHGATKFLGPFAGSGREKRNKKPIDLSIWRIV